MQFPPVIVRELREESHRPATARIRAGAVGIALFTLTMLWAFGEIAEGEGDQTFSIINTLFCVCIWLIVPFMTADCISREKREGTLGLLFLTPLTSSQIIFGKTVCHALRAFGLLLAVMPLMLICFMLGGIGWQVALIALCMNSATLVLALSAGFLASSYTERWNRAIGSTIVVTAVFLALYALNIALAGEWFSPRKVRWDVGNLVERLFEMGFGAGREWTETRRGFGFAQIAAVCAQCFFFALGVSGASLWLARRQIGKARCAEPVSRQRQAIERAFWKPRFGRGLFRRRMNRKLDRNPIGWLQRYSTGSRLVSGTWVLGIIVIESWIFSGKLEADVPGWTITLALLMLTSVAFVAAGSFTAERQSGALELILVTPLSVGQIVRGRLLGVLGQFALASALLIGSYFYYRTFGLDHYGFYRRSMISNPIPVFVYFLFPWGMVTLSIIGLFFSLRQKGFLSALLATVAFGVFLPLACLGLFDALMWKLDLRFLRIDDMLGYILDRTGLISLIHEEPAFILLFAFAQLPVVLWAFVSLTRKLRDRKFIMTAS